DGRRVLVLAVEPDDGGLAVALRRAAERGDGLAAEQRPQLLAHRHQRGQVLDPPAGEGVVDHRDRGGLADGAGRLATAVGADLLDDRHELPDLRHPSPPSPTGGTGTGSTSQISRAYSATVRSLENRPIPATFAI